jgi:cytochrome c551/c552
MMKQFLIVLAFFVAGCTSDDKKASTDDTIAEENINGEILFKANCASCHKPDKDFTAPALKGALQRWSGDKKTMYAFISNSTQSENAYTKALKKKWAPAIMTSFKLSDAELDAIMKYVETSR